jgi:hypothetical protein
MSDTVVVNVRRQRCDVLIDRRTMYGNRFVIGRDGNRATVIEKHMHEWRGFLLNPATKAAAVAELRKLKGKRLGCHCAPRPCHGDNYVKLIAEFA